MNKALTKRVPFPRVQEARNALAERAIDLLNLQLDMIKEAFKQGDREAAIKANQWLIEHMPVTPDGAGIIGSSAAEPKELEEGSSRIPAIQIGIALGRAEDIPKQITGQVIDIPSHD